MVTERLDLPCEPIAGLSHVLRLRCPAILPPRRAAAHHNGLHQKMLLISGGPRKMRWTRALFAARAAIAYKSISSRTFGGWSVVERGKPGDEPVVRWV